VESGSEKPWKRGECNVMRVVEVGMSYCPSFSAIDVVESQEDMDIKGNES